MILCFLLNYIVYRLAGNHIAIVPVLWVFPVINAILVIMYVIYTFLLLMSYIPFLSSEYWEDKWTKNKQS